MAEHFYAEGVVMILLDGIVFSLQSQGGVSVCFLELLKRLSSLDIGTELLIDEKAPVNGGFGEYLSIVRRPARFAERYRDCPVSEHSRLFHSSYYRLPASHRVKVLTTVYDFTYEHFLSGPRRWVHSWQKFRAIRGSDLVICISENTRRDLFAFLPAFPRERVHVVHLGVSDLFHPLAVASGNARPYVLFVGRRDADKNFSAAVETIARLDWAELRCVGGGSFNASEIRQLERCIPGRYRHMGSVSTEELNRLYNGALCLLYPSAYEGFGIPVLEAMRAGCPVVALNASSIPEVAGDAACLVDVAEPELLALAIGKMRDASYREDLRARGFVRAAGFSWDKTFAETMRLYEKLLGRSLMGSQGTKT